MDIYTKIFLINWVVLASVLLVDMNILGGIIEKYAKKLLEWWSYTSLAATPIWLIYFIINW